MTDIVTNLKEAVCLPDTGCMSVVTCVCDIMQDAADEIERLHQTVSELRGVIAASRRREEISSARITELNGFLNTANEQAGALENENGELREEVQRLRVEAGYD